MNTIFAAFIGGWEMILILAVVLILFGAKKLPELAKGLGQGIKEFKKASREVTEELHNSMEEEPPRPAPKKLVEATPPAPHTAHTVSQSSDKA